MIVPLRWRHNEQDGVSNHQPYHLFTQPFGKTQIKENTKAPRCWPLCEKFTGTGEFPAQMASNAENISIWWRHHVWIIVDNSWAINIDMMIITMIVYQMKNKNHNMYQITIRPKTAIWIEDLFSCWIVFLQAMLSPSIAKHPGGRVVYISAADISCYWRLSACNIVVGYVCSHDLRWRHTQYWTW